MTRPEGVRLHWMGMIEGHARLRSTREHIFELSLSPSSVAIVNRFNLAAPPEDNPARGMCGGGRTRVSSHYEARGVRTGRVSCEI